MKKKRSLECFLLAVYHHNTFILLLPIHVYECFNKGCQLSWCSIKCFVSIIIGLTQWFVATRVSLGFPTVCSQLWDGAFGTQIPATR